MKYVRVMDGLKSNASGFEYKIDEVNIAANWNPEALNPEDFGGFNFGTEDKILRWLHRGDTIYDVIIPCFSYKTNSFIEIRRRKNHIMGKLDSMARLR